VRAVERGERNIALVTLELQVFLTVLILYIVMTLKFPELRRPKTSQECENNHVVDSALALQQSELVQ